MLKPKLIRMMAAAASTTGSMTTRSMNGMSEGAAATMTNVINNAEKAGRKPDENWIQIVMSSH